MREFKEIPGYPGYKILDDGVVISKRFGKAMKPATTSKGYLRVSLMVDGKASMQMVHRLVALAFVPNVENKPFINHINGIKTDNRRANLEWVTATENNRHARKVLGLCPKGQSVWTAKLTDSEAVSIRNLKGGDPDEIAAEFGVDRSTILRIWRRATWRHV